MSAFGSLPLIAAAFWLAGTLVPAAAGDLPFPTGEVILTIEGEITHTNVNQTAQFDRDMLEAMGLVDVTTGTPWYKGRMTFSGPLLSVVLNHVGVQGDMIKAVALNDYETDIPVSDAEETGVILAIKRNGEDMAIRDKGPIFVIYPYDSESRFQTQTYYSRSAWQVTRLIIR